MSSKDHLILLGQVIQDFAGNLLKLRVQKNFRGLHEDDTGNPGFFVRIGLQHGQHVKTLHAVA